jgi:hypothetical protein
MMRGGGETRHLAWARELTAMGVDVEIITGAPLSARQLSGEEIHATVLRSPYAATSFIAFRTAAASDA